MQLSQQESNFRKSILFLDNYHLMTTNRLYFATAKIQV
jgi:hypothetical protein